MTINKAKSRFRGCFTLKRLTLKQLLTAERTCCTGNMRRNDYSKQELCEPACSKTDFKNSELKSCSRMCALWNKELSKAYFKTVSLNQINTG